ncbi:MAG: peptidylprolyl isomerase [bacterium]|nr:peptidylprolyl isomerase [bacterium]
MFSKILGIGVIIALFPVYVRGEVKLVAKVGAEAITIESFKQMYRPIEGANLDSLKNAVLDKLIADKLMIIDARDKGFGKQVADRLRDFKNRLTINSLYIQVVRKRVKVSPWEIRNYWWHLDKEVSASQILVKDKEKAYNVYKELILGKDFAELARQHSEDQRTAEKGGDLGWISWGRMEPELQKVIFSLSCGKISRPIRTRNGYYIIKVNDIKKTKRPDFNKQKDMIKQRLESEKERQLSTDYLEYLKSIAHIGYNQHAIQKLIETLPKVPEEVEKMPLLSWTGGRVIVGDFIKAQRSLRMFDNPKDVEAWVSNWLTFEKLLPATASRHKFEYSKDIKKQLKETEDGLLLQEYRRAEITGRTSVTDDEVLKYYNQNKDKYGKEFERQKYRVRYDLERERQSTVETELIKELRERIPVEIFEETLKEI